MPDSTMSVVSGGPLTVCPGSHSVTKNIMTLKIYVHSKELSMTMVTWL